jgi:hypothetical protein
LTSVLGNIPYTDLYESIDICAEVRIKIYFLNKLVRNLEIIIKIIFLRQKSSRIFALLDMNLQCIMPTWKILFIK